MQIFNGDFGVGSAGTGSCSALAISSCGSSPFNSVNTLLCDTLALSHSGDSSAKPGSKLAICTLRFENSAFLQFGTLNPCLASSHSKRAPQVYTKGLVAAGLLQHQTLVDWFPRAAIMPGKYDTPDHNALLTYKKSK